MNNHAVYANEELDGWTGRSGLIDTEAYLINKYIKNKGSLIEAGTGGGRIALEVLEEYPNLDIVAFDFVEDMIRSAKEKSSAIDFRVSDASDLSEFEDESFEFSIYLQQIVSLVPEELISKVLDESYRILKKDGVILFSFLYYEGRKINPILSFLTNTFRTLRNEKRREQTLPWLKLAGKFNFNLFRKRQATTYWFKKKEIIELLQKNGFEILEVASAKEIQERTSGSEGMLYVVCKK